jgi:3-dehydroquinate synthase
LTPTLIQKVALDERSYDIHIGSHVLAHAGAVLRPLLHSRRSVIVTNPVVAEHWLAPLRTSLERAGIASEVILVPDGESHKNWTTLDAVLTRLLEMKAERSTTLIALGGGVVGDIAGFAAAIYQRGMPMAQVPTTLLAQVDSSVGGKTAVNHPLGKNMIGAFHQPRAVLIDTDVLSTLPQREVIAGLAEVIKYGAIRDAAFFDWIEQNVDRLLERDGAALTHAIAESCRIKATIVAADEREQGERALLNFGHTFGHAIETGTGYGQWLHGEAVAAGMVLASRLSQRVTGLAADASERLESLLRRARLPVVPPSWEFGRWIDLMSHDKKTTAGALRFILLERLGHAIVRSGVPDAEIGAVLPSAADAVV